jgi:hypothetical protein
MVHFKRVPRLRSCWPQRTTLIYADMKKIFVVAFFFFAFFSSSAHAYKSSSYEVGYGFLFAGLADRVTTTNNAKSNFLGTRWDSLHLATVHQYGNAFLNPYLNYSLMQSPKSGGDVKNTVWMLGLPIGYNFAGNGPITDWNYSFGIYNYTLQGSGGTKTLNNGGGTSTFGIPGSSVSSRQFFVGIGVGSQWDQFRVTTDLFALAPLSLNKMTFNWMINFMYSGEMASW